MSADKDEVSEAGRWAMGAFLLLTVGAAAFAVGIGLQYGIGPAISTAGAEFAVIGLIAFAVALGISQK